MKIFFHTFSIVIQVLYTIIVYDRALAYKEILTIYNYISLYPHSTVILRKYFKNISLKACNIAKISKKLLERFLKYCNVRSKHHKWNIAAILIFHFNIPVM